MSADLSSRQRFVRNLQALDKLGQLHLLRVETDAEVSAIKDVALAYLYFEVAAVCVEELKRRNPTPEPKPSPLPFSNRFLAADDAGLLRRLKEIAAKAFLHEKVSIDEVDLRHVLDLAQNSPRNAQPELARLREEVAELITALKHARALVASRDVVMDRAALKYYDAALSKAGATQTGAGGE